MTKPPESWIGAADAVHLLGISRATLYAYVSRGFVRSEPTVGKTRARRYAREDIERLKRRAEERRSPDKVAEHAMQWGLPILESSITLIDGGHLYYRGHDAVQLSRTRSIQEVASLIWTGGFDASLGARSARDFAGRRTTARSSHTLDFIPRAQAMLAMNSADDEAAYDLRPDRVATTGWRIIRQLTRVAGNSTTSPSHSETIDAVLTQSWRAKARAIDVVRAALILCADHELNVSTFTARCIASSGANPYALVIGGLSALEGTRHGGMTIRVEAMLAALHRERRPRAALVERLRRGERIDGFGHPLYRDGDPRAIALLAMLRAYEPKLPELAFVERIANAGTDLTGEHPNLDFALGAVSRVLKLPRGSGLTLFAIGRTIGWIGQAIEQYATGQIIRPRAKYVGVRPDRPAE
jgi:citrate synthase